MTIWGEKKQCLLSVAFGILLLAAAGCAGFPITADYGRIVPMAEVTETFDRYELNPNFHYFISGSDSCPDALIALDKGYILAPTIWKKMEFTPQTFRTLVIDMQRKALELRVYQHGFAILDNKGRPIGVWYSLLFVPTWVRMGGDKTVVIPPPELGVYERRSRQSIIAPLTPD